MNCSLLLASADYDSHDVPEHVDTLVSQWVDGIFLACQPLPEGMFNALQFRETSLVIMDHGQPPPAEVVGLVGFDWENAGYLATRHLIDLGHRCIGYVGASRPLVDHGARSRSPACPGRGRPALRAGVSCRRRLPDRRRLSLRHAASASRPAATGIVLANDMMALGALQAAAELDLRVPRDVSVVGMDDISFAGMPRRP